VPSSLPRIDHVAGGVAASVGAGLFLGLAPAASLAGRWLPLAVLLGVVVGGLAVLSTSDRPLSTVPVSVRRLGFALGTLGRSAAAVALAGTVAAYLTPLVALGVVAAAAALAVAGVPAVVVRLAAVLVAAVLLLVVVACFAIAPVAPAVPVPDGGSVPGVLLAAGLLTVCAFGTETGPRPARLVVLAVVAVLTLAVAVAALHQLGAARLAISPAPVRAALAAADASALDPALLAAVVVGCGFALLAVLRGLPVPGVPRVRLIVAAGVATAAGALLIPATAALAAAAGLLLCDAALRAIAVRHR
jgi:basic amino acid/polyamine antiporter, APA family